MTSGPYVSPLDHVQNPCLQACKCLWMHVCMLLWASAQMFGLKIQPYSWYLYPTVCPQWSSCNKSFLGLKLQINLEKKLAVTQRLTIGNTLQSYPRRKEIIQESVCDVKKRAILAIPCTMSDIGQEMCNIGFTTILWYFWVRTPSCFSIKGDVLSSPTCLHPSCISLACREQGELL